MKTKHRFTGVMAKVQILMRPHTQFNTILYKYGIQKYHTILKVLF